MGRLAIIRASLGERRLRDDPLSIAQLSRIATENGCLQFSSGIGVPTHVIAGDRDGFASAQELNFLTSTFTQGRLILIPGAGHLAHHEDTEAVSAALLAAINHSGS